MRTPCFVVLLLLLGSASGYGQDYLVAVRTLDAETGLLLPFVSVQVAGTTVAGTSDDSGQLTLAVPRGERTFRASFLGYEALEQTETITAAREVVLRLIPAATTLTTVVVGSDDAQTRLDRPVMGVEQLSLREIVALPAALGEVDVLRGLQLFSGVSSAGEISNGLSVRGGTVDQNLVLLDGAPVFTPTHLFGLFSVFTPGAVGSVDLYRANIPARFGGRISAVVDVRSRIPSSDRLRLQGGIGLVSTHLSVETPLTADKTWRLLVAGRAGVNDWVFGLNERLKNTESLFYDGTLKLRFQPNTDNLVTLSGYYSRDRYQFDLLNSFGNFTSSVNRNDYSTLNGTVDWLRVISDRASVLTRLVSSTHSPRLLFPEDDSPAEIEFASRIGYQSVQSGLDYRAAGGHQLAAGVQLVRYALSPGELDSGGSAAVTAQALEEERGVELSVYGEDEWTVSPTLTLSAGLRYTQFAQLGPGTQRTYARGQVPTDGTLEEETTVGAGKIAQRYGGLEPRLGLSYQLSARSRLKASYALTRQYLQNIYNATTPVPTSRWKLSDNNLRPQRAQLYSVGLYRLLGTGKFEASLEGYYRDIDDLLEYRPGADFFLNPRVETDLLQGSGRTYGVEVGIKKKTGKLTGNLNYAYARAENRVPGPTLGTSINRGAWYAGYFDQPHTFNAVLAYDDGKTHRLGVNLIVQSNRPYTVPNGVLRIDNSPVPLFLARNNARLPTYHRLDFSWTIKNASMKRRRWVGEWTLTIYNLYGRDNAYNIYFRPRTADSPDAIFGQSPLGSYQLSIFTAPIPSLSYNFTFE